MNTKPKFCSECGAPLGENDRFCPVCGAKVVDADEPDHKKTPRKKVPTPPPTLYTSGNTTDERKAPINVGKVQHTARFSYRMGAMLIDWSIVIFVGIAIASKMDETTYLSDEDYLVTVIIVSLLYDVIMEASNAQTTIGKYMFGLKVTDMNGARCTFGCTAIRAISRIASLSSLGFGYLMISFTKREQALHDKLAKTLVVEDDIKVKFMKNLLK